MIACIRYIYSRGTIHPIFKVEVSNMSQLRRSLILLVVADGSRDSATASDPLKQIVGESNPVSTPRFYIVVPLLS